MYDINAGYLTLLCWLSYSAHLDRRFFLSFFILNESTFAELLEVRSFSTLSVPTLASDSVLAALSFLC